MVAFVEENGKVVVKATVGGFKDYARSIRSNVRATWKGHFELFDFVDVMIDTLRRGLTRAWYEGAEECGVLPDELTIEEQTELQNVINSEISFTVGFGATIIAGSQTNGGKLRPLSKRAELWINRYPDVQNRAKVSACGDQKLKWVLGPTEHCTSCSNYSQRVYRASIWKKHGVRPKMSTLECEGWRCQCMLQTTNDKITPGFPPAP